jgi:hypothetical protein
MNNSRRLVVFWLENNHGKIALFSRVWQTPRTLGAAVFTVHIIIRINFERGSPHL